MIQRPDGKIVLPINSQLYQERFLRYITNAAANQGYDIADELPAKVMKELVDAVCEQIRREFVLSEADHKMYKAVVIRAIDSMRRKIGSN